MKHKVAIQFATLMFSAAAYTQQMPSVSLFEPVQTFYNPASIGNQDVLSANFFYRTIWIGFEGAPSTQVFCAHAPLRDPSVAMGIMLEHEGIGSTNYTGAYIHYAYRLNLGQNRLSFGLKGGVTTVSRGNVTLRDNAFDRAFSDENETYYWPNFGIGILYYGDQYWAGISIPRMFGYSSLSAGKYRINHDFNRYEYFVTGGGKFSVNPVLTLEPSALLVFSNAYPFRFAFMGMAAYKKIFKAGLGYRLGEALILATGIQLSRQFSLGYSYDMNIGQLWKNTAGSHEININYKFGYKVSASNPRNF